MVQSQDFTHTRLSFRAYQPLCDNIAQAILAVSYNGTCSPVDAELWAL
jgi:hypothetical protein